MSTIQNGNYGGTISKQSDGTFCVMFLYNMSDDPCYIDRFSKGDVYDCKTYKTEKMAIKKINQYIEKQLN